MTNIVKTKKSTIETVLNLDMHREYGGKIRNISN